MSSSKCSQVEPNSVPMQQLVLKGHCLISTFLQGQILTRGKCLNWLLKKRSKQIPHGMGVFFIGSTSILKSQGGWVKTSFWLRTCLTHTKPWGKFQLQHYHNVQQTHRYTTSLTHTHTTGQKECNLCISKEVIDQLYESNSLLNDTQLLNKRQCSVPFLYRIKNKLVRLLRIAAKLFFSFFSYSHVKFRNSFHLLYIPHV